MSIALMTQVWRMDLPSSEKMVLLALADAANDDGVTWLAVVSKQAGKLDLIKKTSLSERTVQRAIQTLCEMGLLEREERAGRGVLYTVTLDQPPSPRHPRHGDTPVTVTPTPVTVTPKPSLNRQIGSKEPISCPAKPNSVPKDDRFSEAWKAYPAKGRERSRSQAKTRPIWKEAARLAGGEDVLLGAVRRYVRDDQTHKGECGPPAFDKWLRDGRWEHWLELETRRVATWTGPAEIRERVVAERGDGFAASYLDPAAWTDTGEILAATGYAAEKLKALGYLRVRDFPT